jgi:2-oxoglutarate ferredoxin oxidoreductase subunit alpha
LQNKLESAVDQFSFYDLLEAPGSETLIIAYGVTARAAKAVYRELNQHGTPISVLILKTLWPVPVNTILKAVRKIKRMLVVEMNLGQYVREIERLLPDTNLDFFGQMNGRLITPTQIKKRLAIG